MSTIQGNDMEAEKANVLGAFSRALQREAHILQDQPVLLWQQLYNRLQWETTPVRDLLGPQLAARRSPWIRTWSPFTESQPLIRTLSGHLKKILTCAISPDGSFIVSGSQDETLKVWDGNKGEERFTLAGHASRRFR